MEVQFRRSVISGKAKAPPSPAVAHRAIIAAALAPGQSVISNLPHSPEMDATMQACRSLGADIVTEGGVADIFGSEELSFPETLHCADSNTALKLLLPIAAVLEAPVEFTGGEALSTRPIGPYAQYLERAGAKTSSTNGFLPMKIMGPITETQLPYFPQMGTQFLSGLMMAAPLRLVETEIGIEGQFPNRQPIKDTASLLQKCGIRVGLDVQDYIYMDGGQEYSPLSDFEIPGSANLSSFPLLAAALCGRITLDGIPQSGQLESLFKSFGAEAISEEGSFFVSAGPLEGAELEAASLGSFILHAIVLGCIAHGETRIHGLPGAGLRNSGRVRLLIRVLSRMGANINESEHNLIINGGRLTGAEIGCEGDAWVGMAVSAAALCADGPTHLQGAECILPHYPGFFSDISRLGAIAREVQKLK